MALDKLVDQVISAVCNTHDGPDLWGHTRKDPEAFRAAVRPLLQEAFQAASRVAEAARSLEKEHQKGGEHESQDSYYLAEVREALEAFDAQKPANADHVNRVEFNELARCLWFSFGQFVNSISDYHSNTPKNDPIWKVMRDLADMPLNRSNNCTDLYIKETLEARKLVERIEAGK